MIRIFFPDGTHEDCEDDSRANRAEDGVSDAMTRPLRDCRPDPYARGNVFVWRGGDLKVAKVESQIEQAHRAEKARADAAEKRIADLREWAEKGARHYAHLADSEAPAGAAFKASEVVNAMRSGRSGALWDVVRHLDGKDWSEDR